jgi:hypothetical protein
MLLFFLSVNISAMNKEVQFSVARFSTQCYNLLFGSTGQVFLSHLSRNEIKPFLANFGLRQEIHSWEISLQFTGRNRDISMYELLYSRYIDEVTRAIMSRPDPRIHDRHIGKVPLQGSIPMWTQTYTQTYPNSIRVQRSINNKINFII